MQVTKLNFDQIVDEIAKEQELGLDTETTGLRWGSKLFSLIISSATTEWYFNFNDQTGAPEEEILPRFFLQTIQVKVFSNPNKKWFIANAKYDMGILLQDDLTLAGVVVDITAIERLVKNNKLEYSLESMAETRGWKKDDAVENYITKHKLYSMVQIPGKKKREKDKFFYKVPHEIMAPYGTQDARLHFDIGKSQEKLIAQISADPNYKPLTFIHQNEIELTKNLFAMERLGIQVDIPFTKRALEYEQGLIQQYQQEFKNHTGFEFQDSSKLFVQVFDSLGEKYPLTAKGNPSFAAEVLESMTSPVAGIINNIRKHEKYAGTYYSSFLHYADENGIIHADCRQGGTETGRVSYRDPNLQNVPKEDEEEDQLKPFQVRQSFIPRPGNMLVSVDFEQMEYRMMLAFANQRNLIEDVMNGADVHTATAKLVGITRKQAKTLNFALLYGAGVLKIAESLGITPAEAADLKALFFSKLPQVQAWIRRVTQTGEKRGWIFNYYGRRCHISEPEFAYILPNHYIQGSCADAMKIAMNGIFRERFKTPIVIQVHDELVFDMSPGNEHEVRQFRDIMENAFPGLNGMRLTTSADHSYKSWGFKDKVKGEPNGSEKKTSDLIHQC